MSDTYVTVIASEDGAREKFVTAMQHAKTMLMNGESVQLSVGPSVLPISDAQRKLLHGHILRQISEQVEVPIFDARGVDTGRRTRYVIKTWKRYFKERFLGFKWTQEDKIIYDKKTGRWRPSRKKTPIKTLISTESLGPAKYSKFIDQVIDHAITEYGVDFSFDQEERERARYVEKPRKAAMQ